MATSAVNISGSIFEEPPDDLDLRTGALLVNWDGATGREAIELARAYATAGRRLLDAACNNEESWESVDPILFCFRHAIELYLKALALKVRAVHPLKDLADELQLRLQGHYRAEQLDWLCERIREFDRVDPRSTSFRYYDAVVRREPELWVDFFRLRAIMEAIFEGLERVRLDASPSEQVAKRR